MCVNILWWASSSKAFYRVAAEPGEAAQLYVFILGMWYLSLGVLRCVFGVRYAVSVLVARYRCTVLAKKEGSGKLSGVTTVSRVYKWTCFNVSLGAVSGNLVIFDFS